MRKPGFFCMGFCARPDHIVVGQRGCDPLRPTLCFLEFLCLPPGDCARRCFVKSDKVNQMVRPHFWPDITLRGTLGVRRRAFFVLLISGLNFYPASTILAKLVFVPTRARRGRGGVSDCFRFALLPIHRLPFPVLQVALIGVHRSGCLVGLCIVCAGLSWGCWRLQLFDPSRAGPSLARVVF